MTRPDAPGSEERRDSRSHGRERQPPALTAGVMGTVTRSLNIGPWRRRFNGYASPVAGGRSDASIVVVWPTVSSTFECGGAEALTEMRTSSGRRAEVKT